MKVTIITQKVRIPFVFTRSRPHKLKIKILPRKAKHKTKLAA